MRTMCAMLIVAVALVVAVGLPANAEIVEVATSVSMPTPPSEDELRSALHAAAKDVISNTTTIEPVVVALTGAYLSAGRLYFHFLLADEAGARLLGMVRPRGDADDGAAGRDVTHGGDDLRI